MSVQQKETLEEVPSRVNWYEKDCDDWDEQDEYEALCDLFEAHH